METNTDAQDTGKFFAEELLSVLLREAGTPWNDLINYSLLPPHLRAISERVRPLVNGVNIFSVRYKNDLRDDFNSIRRNLEQIAIAEKSDCVYKILITAASNALSGRHHEERTFVFIRLVLDVCIWFRNTDQIKLIPVAASALQHVLTKILPGGFPETLERLIDYMYAFHNRHIPGIFQ